MADETQPARWGRFLAVMCTTVLLLAAGVIFVNVVGDAGVIYLKRHYAERESMDFAEELMAQPVGGKAQGNERTIKLALAKAASEHDCAIIGSSRVLQVSTVRPKSSVSKSCRRLLNLGVSGGSLEDLLIYAREMMVSGELPERVYVGLDPWMLKFGMDARYALYEDRYRQMLDELGGRPQAASVSYRQRQAENLLNWEYFRASAEALQRDGIPQPRSDAATMTLSPVEPFDLTVGLSHNVWLADGSLVYNQGKLQAFRRKLRKLNGKGGSYKIEPPLSDPKAERVVTELWRRLSDRGTEVVVMLIPYHPVVFARGAARPQIVAAEARIRALAEDSGVLVFGSYDPSVVGCRKQEYYDAIHPTKRCIGRLSFGKPTSARR